MAQETMNQYLLKGNRKAESWQVRNNRVFINDGNRRRQIRYCEGESSIFLDEQNKESKPTYIWIEKGNIRISKDDSVKNRFMQMHPDFDKKFYLYNPESETDELLSKMELVEEVRELLKELNEGQREAVATVLFGLNTAKRWTASKIKLELYKFVESNPTKLKGIIKDPNTEMTYLVAAAIKLGIVEVSKDQNSILWSDTKLEIIPIPRGVNPLREMAVFLRSTDGTITLQQIGDKVSEQKPKTTAKKTVVRNTLKKGK